MSKTEEVSVLVIDDDPDIRHALGLMLRTNGFGVSLAENGAEGLSRLQQHGADIVLTDMTLPGLSGVEVIRQVRERDPATWIIAMSGGMTASRWTTLHRATQAGADICLDKPFDPGELLEAVAGMMRQSAMAAALR